MTRTTASNFKVQMRWSLLSVPAVPDKPNDIAFPHCLARTNDNPQQIGLIGPQNHGCQWSSHRHHLFGYSRSTLSRSTLDMSKLFRIEILCSCLQIRALSKEHCPPSSVTASLWKPPARVCQ